MKNVFFSKKSAFLMPDGGSGVETAAGNRPHIHLRVDAVTVGLGLPDEAGEFVHLVKMSVDLENQPDLETHFDESEFIETFLVGQDELAEFIRKAEREGCGVDTKMYMWAISRGGFDV